jgi:50S ribosomal protein L4
MLCSSLSRLSLVQRVVVHHIRASGSRATQAPFSSLPSNLIMSDEIVVAPPVTNSVSEPPSSSSQRAAAMHPKLEGIDATFTFPLAPGEEPTSVPIFDFNSPGKVVAEAPLESTIFRAPLRKDVVLQCIVYERHKRRQPKKTKRSNEIRGSTRKPRPQKGGGKSQVGNRRNAAWRGGMKAHGPVLRDYSIKLPRKFRALGFMIALAAKQREGNLVAFDAFRADSPRTKLMVELLREHRLLDPGAGAGADDGAGVVTGPPGSHTTSLLICDPEEMVVSADSYQAGPEEAEAVLQGQRNFGLALRNLPVVRVLPLNRVTILEFVTATRVGFTAAALESLQRSLMERYTHTGRRGRREKALGSYLELVNSVPPEEAAEDIV